MNALSRPMPAAVPPTEMPVELLDKVLEVVVRDACREFGVSPTMLTSQTRPLQAVGPAAFQLRLLITRWDQNVWTLAPALGQLITERLRELRPKMASQLREVVWEASDDSGYPFRKANLVGKKRLEFLQDQRRMRDLPSSPSGFSATELGALPDTVPVSLKTQPMGIPKTRLGGARAKP